MAGMSDYAGEGARLAIYDLWFMIYDLWVYDFAFACDSFAFEILLA